MHHDQTLYFIVPGDIHTRTGGYRYDKRIIDGLRLRGWSVELISLCGDFPFPDETALSAAAAQLQAIPDSSLVVIDGLAFSVIPAQLEPHRSRLQLIALIHHPLALETGLTPSNAIALQTLETKALSHASRVITTSHTTALSLEDYAVPTEKRFVVCPGSIAAPLASGSEPGKFNLLCVATLTQRKGHAVLLQALQQVKHLNWHLYCVGSADRDTVTSKALLKQCEALALTHRVTFLGELDDQQLNAQYLKSDLFVLASFHEGYGMVLDEAIAYGLPIVATTGGAIADTVPKGVGLLAPPNDASALAEALRTFIEDDTMRSSLCQAARHARKVQRSWDEAMSEFEAVLSYD